MKNHIIIMMILLSFGKLFSQNSIDPPKLSIDFNDASVFDRNWNQTHFIKGWNWGGAGLDLDEALNMNYYHRGFNSNDDMESLTSSALYIANHRQINQLQNLSDDEQYLVGGYNSDAVFNAQAISLIPVLSPDSTTNFKPRAYDGSGSVFGFYFKRKVRILDSSQHSNPNYHFALLDKDSITSAPDTVFKKAWNCNYLKFLWYGLDESISDYTRFNGTHLYLTINLKSRESISTQYLNDTILRIRLPYTLAHTVSLDPPTYTYTTGNYIKFDSLASESINNVRNVDTIYNQDRGRYKTLYATDPANKPTEFAITGRMLRFSLSNPADSSLTLSAFFECNSDRILNHNVNPYLNYEGARDTSDFISDLDVEVIYCGKIDLGIKYIRIESPRAQAMFRGYYDHLVRDAANFLIDRIRGNTNGVRLHRFYGNDEVYPRCWSASRYYNMLLDTLAGLETWTYALWDVAGGEHQNQPSHYLHATGHKEFFFGSTPKSNSENILHLRKREFGIEKE